MLIKMEHLIPIDITVYRKLKVMEILLNIHRYIEFTTDTDESKRYISESEQKVLVVIDYLRNHYSEPVLLEDLVERSGLSRSQFIRIFKKLTNLKTREFINKIRITKARELFANMLSEHRTQSIAQVCHEVGYDDLSTFYRVFKKETGNTPKQFIHTLTSV